MAGRNERLVCSVSIAALACILGFATPPSARAEDDLRDRFKKACKADIDKNNPVWSPDQALQLCDCRARFLWAKQSKSDIGLIVTAAERNELMGLPETLVKADLDYFKICRKDFSATP